MVGSLLTHPGPFRGVSSGSRPPTSNGFQWLGRSQETFDVSLIGCLAESLTVGEVGCLLESAD